MRTPRDVRKGFREEAGSEAGFGRLRAAIQRKERITTTLRVIVVIGGVLIFLWMLNSI